MRKVHLMMITPEMTLGRTIYCETVMLIRKGTSQLNRYVNKLSELGIDYIYVEDEISEGIEIPDAISEKTRNRCKNVLADTFVRFRESGGIDSEKISAIVTQLMDEVMSQPNIIVSLNDMGSSKDETLIHCVNTAVYGLILANRVGFGEVSLRDLAQGLLLHDIGKTALDQSVLFKNGTLSEEEFSHIKQHPVLGYDILKKDPLLTEAARQIALYHHERLDGSGYVYGSTRGELNKLIRIASIVDVYEALTSKRCYRNSYMPSKAAEILTQEASEKLDAELVAQFFQSIAIYPNGNMLLLSNGSMAVVKEQNPGMPFRPVVRLLEKGKGEPGEEIDLAATLNITILEDDPALFGQEK